MADSVLADKVAVYEGMFILDSNRLARDRDGLPGEVKKLIESAGGQLEVHRLWEERRLAYPIRGQRKGAYWITYFRMPTSGISGLTRGCELNEGILRQLFVRLPDPLVEHILDHAKGVAAAPVEEPTEDVSATTKASENGEKEEAVEPEAAAAAPAAVE